MRLLPRLAALLGAGLLLASCLDLAEPRRPTAALTFPDDSLRLTAVRDSLPLSPTAVDAGGVPLRNPSITFTSLDTAVAVVTAEGVVVARGNGTTALVATAASGVAGTLTVVVRQEADSLDVRWLAPDPVALLRDTDTLPLACAAWDHNGIPLADPPDLTSRNGVVAPGSCVHRQPAHSGLDTLTIVAGTLAVDVPVAIALAPVTDDLDGYPVPLDIPPAGQRPWAPTLIRNARGDLDLYFGNYLPDSTSPIGARGNLARYVSTDGGASFRWDGEVVQRDTLPCSPAGDGIENIAIAPRADAPGWRMFFAAGGFTCYGWQVFSAVSDDQVAWQREPGVRVSNGGTLPPAAPVGAPWPMGEGMVVDRLPDGAWRMIAGTYEPLTPPVARFEITEWRSDDQLTWSYVRTLLRTTDVGPEAQRSIYSPTIREFAPGLYRMVFTGDNRNQPGGLSRLYSAVSIDMVHWQVEGVLLSSASANLFYSSLVDDLLVFVRQDPGAPVYLAMARVAMP